MHPSKYLLLVCFLMLYIEIVQSPAGTVLNCKDQQPGFPDACRTCQDLYTQVGGSCCINWRLYCSSCYTDSNKCDSCQSNSYCFQNDVCPSCSSKLTYCLTCSSCSSCLTCVSNQYVLNSSTCALCSQFMPNCSMCTSVTVCTNCVTTFTLNSTECITCSSVLSDCLQCISQTFCTKCTNNTFTLNLSQCVACSILIPYCLDCSSSSICTSCINNTFAISLSSFQCFSCSKFIAYCTNCNSQTICINCDATFSNIILNNNKCVSCRSLIPNCLNCSKIDTCTACSERYTLRNILSTVGCVSCGNVIDSCIKCLSTTICTQCMRGWIVTNGCSNIPGCISVMQKMNKAICIECNSTEFSYEQVNKTCTCLKGHLVGRYCTEIIGCISIIRRDKEEDFCSLCNGSLYFAQENGTCVCQQFFELNGLQCTQICGDGKLFNLPCDDGNLLNGDGCSSTCHIQSGYICKQGNSTQQSNCIYSGRVKLKHICTYKLQKNFARIELEIYPYVSSIQKSNLTFTFQSSRNCSMVSFQVHKENIYLFINYQQDIEGTIARITLAYDFRFILSPKSNISIDIMQCNGNKLIYDSNISTENQQIIIFLIQILCGLALFIWLIGSYSHKMIGVQTLHTFHLIFIMQSFSSRYFPVVVYFSGLHHTLNTYQNKLTPQAVLKEAPYNHLIYSADFFCNHGVITMLQMVALILFIVLVYWNYNNLTFERNLLNKTQIQVRRLKKFIYNFLVFPLIIGFFLNFTISLFIYSQISIPKQYQGLYLQIMTMIFAVFANIFVFCWQWKYLFINPKRNKKVGYKRYYIQVYLSYIFILSLVIQASIAQLISIPLQSLACIVVIYLIIIWRHKPYKNSLHNIGIIVNQIGLVINITWIISQHSIQLTRSQEETISFGIIAWMVLMCLIAFIRTIFQLKKHTYLASKQQKNKATDQIQDIRQNQNKIMNKIIRQSTKNINPYRISSQISREREILQYQRNLQRNQKLNLQFLRNKLKGVSLDEQEENKNNLVIQKTKKMLSNELKQYQ